MLAESKNLPKTLQFDNCGEEAFYTFLQDYGLTSMIKGIKSQVWVNTFSSKRRIDFVLTLSNGKNLYLEFDGAAHDTVDGIYRDSIRNGELKQIDIHLLRIKYRDFINMPDLVASKIEGWIDLLSS